MVNLRGRWRLPRSAVSVTLERVEGLMGGWVEGWMEDWWVVRRV